MSEEWFEDGCYWTRTTELRLFAEHFNEPLRLQQKVVGLTIEDRTRWLDVPHVIASESAKESP